MKTRRDDTIMAQKMQDAYDKAYREAKQKGDAYVFKGVLFFIACCLVALWFIHVDSPMHNGGNRVITAKETYHVIEAKYGRGNFMHGGDEEKSYSESYTGTRTYACALPYSVVNSYFPYSVASPYVGPYARAYANNLAYAASPYASDLGRTSPSVEALWVQAPLNAPRRSTLTAFSSDGIKDII